MTDFQTGLMISAIGLLVTFTALSVFIGVIVVLQKLFPPKAEEGDSENESSSETFVVEIETEADDEEIAAALAAVAFIRAQRTGQLGSSLLTGPGPYRTSR